MLASDSIVFQLHENDATSYIKQAAKFTKGLQELNIKSSINHFGCSLNPFNLPKHLAPDIVKLDGSFANQIEEIAENREERVEMVRALQASGVLTAISGMEDLSILPTLFMTGINYIQGNYISDPLDGMDYNFLRKVSRKPERSPLDMMQFCIPDTHQIKKAIQA
jgi:EAL domain-containing protein (putative c-di-GMP-specific phosphodiesterase class I)